MELDPGLVKSGLAELVPSRYQPPQVARFWNSDGPYAKTHRYDALHGRDIEFCEERLWIVKNHLENSRQCSMPFEDRMRFVMEAQIGALNHPNIPLTYDFGWSPHAEVGELFYFTRPPVGGSFSGHLNWPIKLSTLLALLDLLDRQEDRWPDWFVSERQSCVEQFSWWLERGWVLAVREPRALSSKLLSRQTADEKSSMLAEMNQALERADRQADEWIKSGGDESTRESLRKDARSRVFKKLMDDVIRRSGWNLPEAGVEERLVQLNFPKYIEALSSACSAVQHAHRHGVLHLSLSEASLGFGLDDDRAYVVDWRHSHIAGAPWRPGEHLRYRRLAEVEGSWETDDKVEFSERTDVFLLGKILEFLLYEPAVDGKGKDRRFRAAFFSPQSSTDGERELLATMERLKSVAQTATSYQPEDRYATAADFAEAIIAGTHLDSTHSR